MSRTTVTPAQKKYTPISGNDTAAYEQAQREAARRKKIQEYQNFITGIKNVTTKILSVDDDLLSASKTIMKSITGNYFNRISKTIENVQNGIKDMVNGLNAAGKRASEEINKEGEPCTFDKAQTKTETTYNEQNKLQFSCDTNLLRNQVLPALKKSWDKLTDTSNAASKLPKLEGCENISGLSGIIDATKSGIKEIYGKVEKLIENTEKAEKENSKIVENLFNVGGNLFKPSNKEKESQTPKTRTPTMPTKTTITTEPTKLTTPTRITTARTTTTRTITEHPKNKSRIW